MRARVLAVITVAIALGLPVVGEVSTATAAPDADKPAYAQTKHLSRSIIFDGQPIEIDSRDVTVTADRTTELRGRERIQIGWSGAHPSGGRAASPFGELGMLQEYPVVIMQCRGLDDPTLPVEQQLAPETCWTSSRIQRSQSIDESQAVWRKDALATDAARDVKSGLVPAPPECNDPPTFSTHITSFRAAGGTVYASCTAETMGPEAAVGAAFPAAEMAAFTDGEGNGSVKFEVRTDIENESLGCSDTVACSVVVVPIEGISCATDDGECSKAGRFAEGSSNFASEGVDLAVSGQLWWSASNWNNRFSIPLDFGLAPDACDVLDSRPPTGFYGSELMAQASLQWSPAYCLDKERFKFQHNKISDEAGFTLAETGGGAAAFVSGEHETRGADPVAYAPTAVTGFSIAYIIDRPDNAGEFTDLKLNARLLAKLMTQSYAASERGRSHPGMSANPISINLDPEFQKLNPGLDSVAREAGATLLSLSESSDVLSTLTSYIAQDKDAMDFINGKPDPWGMQINPSYKKISLPTSEWPLLDDFVAPSNLECYQQNPAPYFTQIAAPVTSLRKIAEGVLDAWPNVQTKCDRATSSDPWKIGRVDRQGVGTRFMLGLVSTGDAERLGLAQAALETAGQTYVGPTPDAMARAIRLAVPSKSGDAPFTLDMKDVVRAQAYPGTMVVYTAARTANLPAEDAAKVAEFVRVSTTEGQKVGYGNGQLPLGYLPIARTGVTAPLWQQAQVVATAIGAQKGVTSTDTGADGSGAGGGDGGTGTGTGTGTGGGGVGTDVGPGSVTSVDGTDAGTTRGDGAGSGEAPDKNKDKNTGKDTSKDPGKDTQEPVAMPP
ncbi:MAG: hypothetical protein ABIO16_11515, partial [Nocardioides sp.]